MKLVGSTKEQIIKLREEKKSYNAIAKELGVSKATVSYHCKKLGIEDIGLVRNYNYLTEDNIKEINEFYKKTTFKETIHKYNITATVLKKLLDPKRIILTEKELKSKNYQRVKTRRQELKLKAVEYKGGKCEKCGYNKCIWVFDFHHIIPSEKDFSIARYSTLSWDKIKPELDKCIMLCANCHRELHHNEFYSK